MSFCKTITDFLNKSLPEPERPTTAHYEMGQKYDRWIDYAEDAPQMRRRGKYLTNSGFPDGLVIHYTAGRGNGLSNSEYARKQGLSYLVLDKDGTLWQGAPLDQWGYHAGKSSMKYKNRTVTSVSKYLIGVEVISAGMLFGAKNGKRIDFSSNPSLIDNYDGQLYGWWAFHSNGILKPHQLPATPGSIVKYTEKKGNIKPGFYEKYTSEQMEGLYQLVYWLKGVNPDFSFDYILGHDEVSPDRKSDPGGSLGMSMANFRKSLKESNIPSMPSKGPDNQLG